jgi:hypothetical protein
VGNPYRTHIVVGIPNGNPGHGRSVVIAIPVVGAIGLARILDCFVEPVDKLQVVHIHSVVVDSDSYSVSCESIGLPNIDNTNHIVHPRVSLVQRIGGVCGIQDAGCWIVAKERTKITVGITSRDEGVPIYVGIGTRPVSGTIVTTLGIETSVAVQVEFLAVAVAIDAVLEETFVVRPSVIRIVTGSVAEG